MQEPRQKRPGETLFGVAMLLFSLFVLVQAYGIAGFSALSSPGAFPMTAAALMVIATAITLLRGRQLRPEQGGLKAFLRQITPARVVVFLLFIVAFAVSLDQLGFLPSALGFLVVSIAFLHRRGPVRAVLVSLLAIVVIYVVFRLAFKVVLPEGIVPEREILAWIGDLLSGWFGRGEPPA